MQGNERSGTDTALRAAAALQRVGGLLTRRPFLIVSDFDGTLSQIVMDPWGASILPTAQRALRVLARTSGVHVAILSGRTALDVAGRTGVGGAAYIGNHGMERGWLPPRGRAGRMAVEVVPVGVELRHEAERIAAGVATLIPESWLIVERKPPAVAFHFRAAPDVDQAGTQVRAAVDRLDPARVFTRQGGRRVLELRPPGAPDKGTAFRDLIGEWQPAAALMLGDDVSDADAFVALREARAQGVLDGLAIGVQARHEVPAAVTEAADLVLASPMEAARFLAGLARAFASQRQPVRTVSRS